jgi:hypothetical protein
VGGATLWRDLCRGHRLVFLALDERLRREVAVKVARDDETRFLLAYL